jgi:hypothetical protein
MQYYSLYVPEQGGTRKRSEIFIALLICLVTKNVVEVHYVRALPILGGGLLWRPSVRLRCTQSKLFS